MHDNNSADAITRGTERALLKAFSSIGAFDELNAVISDYLDNTAEIAIGYMPVVPGGISKYFVQRHGVELFNSVSYAACVEFALKYKTDAADGRTAPTT